MIHIFTCCTGAYNDLWDQERIERLNYLFPTYDKTFNLISDVDNLYKFKFLLNNEYCSFNYYHICNLTYPFVTLHKYDYIYDMCKELKYNKYDYFVYFDAHSWILEKSQEYWDNIIENEFGQYDICYTRNPYYDNEMIFDEVDDRSKHYVDKETMQQNLHLWSQMSYLSGTVNGLHKFKNSINQLLLDDIMYTGDSRLKQCILPNFMEQHYANYIIFDCLLNGNDYIYNINFFTGKYVCLAQNECDHDDAFIMCHYWNNQDDVTDAISKKHHSQIYDDKV